MLSSRYRFHGYGSLRYLLKNGQTSRNRVLAVRYIKNPHRSDSRVAVVVGKKVSKSAVKRNRIRRRVFEVIRTNWDKLEPGYDFSIAVFSAELLVMPHKDLEKNILTALGGAIILNNKKENKPDMRS